MILIEVISVLLFFSLFHRLNLAEELLFDLIKSPNLDPSAYSILMTGYNLHHQPDKTLKMFYSIQRPNAISYLLSFQACSQLKDLQQGKILLEKLGQSNINLQKEFKLQTALIDVSREK